MLRITGGKVYDPANGLDIQRRFRRFDPGEGTESARTGKQAWRRAVRAALAWARDAG